MGSQLTGNVIGGVVLRSGGSETMLFIIFAILAVVGSFLHLLLVIPK
jgi:hypothetical protein